MFDRMQGFLYRVTLSLLVLLSQASTDGSSKGVPGAGSPACAGDDEVNSADTLCNPASGPAGYRGRASPAWPLAALRSATVRLSHTVFLGYGAFHKPMLIK